RGRGENLFRVAFGHVFEAYVGDLLRQGCGPSQVRSEFEYVKGRKSPDWMVIQGDTLVVIEVKQSALTLNAKVSGDVEVARSSLTRTLGKGVRQLTNFRKHLLHVGVPGFEDVKRVVLLVVSQDDIPSGNFVLPPLIEDADDVQFASIEEFELL